MNTSLSGARTAALFITATIGLAGVAGGGVPQTCANRRAVL